MTGESVAHEAQLEAREALTRVDAHIVECTRHSVETTQSINRLHERIDGLGRQHSAMVFGVALTAISGLVQIALHFMH